MPILLILDEQRENRALRQFLLRGWTQLTKPIDLSRMLTTINDVLTNVPAGRGANHFKSEHAGAPEPFEADWLNGFRWTSLNRMRN